MTLFFWFDHSLGAMAEISQIFCWYFGKLYSEIIWPLAGPLVLIQNSWVLWSRGWAKKKYINTMENSIIFVYFFLLALYLGPHMHQFFKTVTYPLLCGLLLEALVKLELEIRAAAVFNLFRSTAVKGTHFKIFMVVSVIVTHFLSHRRTWKMEKWLIHYLKNKKGVVDFANAQGLVMF